MTSKWAPDNAEGLHAYVRTERCWGRATETIRYAASLADAKRDFGWTQMRYTTISVRRALADDLVEPQDTGGQP